MIVEFCFSLCDSSSKCQNVLILVSLFLFFFFSVLLHCPVVVAFLYIHYIYILYIVYSIVAFFFIYLYI